MSANLVARQAVIATWREVKTHQGWRKTIETFLFARSGQRGCPGEEEERGRYDTEDYGYTIQMLQEIGLCRRD
jgi:hypothetical protein